MAKTLSLFARIIACLCVYSFLVLSFAGCSKKYCIRHSSLQEQSSTLSSNLVRDTDQELSMIWNLVMRATDVPMPLAMQLLHDHGGPDEDGSFYFCYSAPQTCQQLLQFYQIEMERLGWKLTSLLSLPDNSQCVTVFQKPSHQAIIIMYPSQNEVSTQVTFYFLCTKQ